MYKAKPCGTCCRRGSQQVGYLSWLALIRPRKTYHGGRKINTCCGWSKAKTSNWNWKTKLVQSPDQFWVLQEGQPEDLDARAGWSWWKAKKWALHITYRLFTRYGDPKASRSGPDGVFITMFSQQCSLKFLEAHMKVMSSYAQV